MRQFIPADKPVGAQAGLIATSIPWGPTSCQLETAARLLISVLQLVRGSPEVNCSKRS